jgi:hypothetical protein
VKKLPDKKPGNVASPPTPGAVMTAEEIAANPTMVAQSVLHPVVRAAYTMQAWNPFSCDLDIAALNEELKHQVKRIVIDGEMTRAETMLVSQAHTLDAIFNSLAQRASNNINNHPTAAELFLRLAMRAQSQSRATLETLSLLKNPPSAAFIRQANFANGPQQVNNAAADPDPPAHAGKIDRQPNKILEVDTNERLDIRAPAPAIGTHTALATVGKDNRSQNRKRKGRC